MTNPEAENFDEEDLENHDDPVEMDATMLVQNATDTSTKNPWECIKEPLKTQLKMSHNVLWAQAVKQRFIAAEQPPLFK